MNKVSLLETNEQVSNRFAAQIMLVTISFIALTMFLNIINIFIVPMNTMIIAMSGAALLLITPFILIFVFKLSGWILKYVIATLAILMVTTTSMLLSYHTVLLYIYPLAIASLYFSRRLSWFTTILTVVAVTTAQYFGTGFQGVVDRNFENQFELLLYGIIPRDIEFLAISVIFILLSKRTRDMLQNVVGAEEQKDILGRMISVTDKAREASDTLSRSVSQLSEITNNTARANGQIAQNTSKIAGGSESTLQLVEEASRAAEDISATFNMVAREGQKIAEVSMNVSRLTRDNGEVIAGAVSKMEEIGKATELNKAIIMKLGEQSNEIGQIVEIISSIAGQTNMLALNAAIESARAGEQGKGFAVVADEVRSLAEQSDRAAKDIAKLIAVIISDTTEAIGAMDKSSKIVKEGLTIIKEAGSAFNRVSEAGTRMDGMVQQVSSSTTTAANSSNKLAEIVGNISEINHTNLSELQGIAAAAQEQLAAMQQVASSVMEIERISGELLQVIKS
jgi:methyl-accepting chemotaxis protein